MSGGEVERVEGIEPSSPAWKAGALPLSNTRSGAPRLAPSEGPVNPVLDIAVL